MNSIVKLRCLLLAVPLLALALPQVADAQAPKYRRTSKMKKISVKQTQRTRKKATGKKKKSEVKPQLSADDFIAVQGKVRSIRKKQIALYAQLIRDSEPGDPQLPDYLFRLADAYAQQQRYWRFRAGELYAKIDSAKSNSKKSEYKRTQAKYKKAEKQYMKQAIKVYQTLTSNRKYRSYANMDQALFYYAFTLQGAKYIDQARTVYRTLIQNYPKSKYIPEAFLSFADYFFNENKLAQAEKFYNKVLEYPKSQVYNYALYKTGWVYLNQARFQKALETFFDVVQKTKRNKRAATINKAAKKDFVRAYAEVGRHQKAYQAFQRVDKGYAFKMLQILGDLYLDDGAATKAIFTFREMIKLKPKNQKVCEWQYNVFQAMLTEGTKKQKVQELERLVKLYQAYRDRKLLKGSYLSECRDNAKYTTNELAKVWHNEAIKTLNTDTLAYVERLYKVYIEVFRNAKDLGEMQFYYAELLWQRAEAEQNQRVATELWERAALAFTDVVKTKKVSKKLVKEAAYASVLGWKNALAVDPRTKVKPAEDNDSNKKVVAKEIPRRQLKMIEAFDIYINYVKDPKDDELVVIKFLKARIYWRYGHYDKAVPLFRDVLNKHRSSDEALYSANIVLNILIEQDKPQEVLALANNLAKDKEFMSENEELAERLRGIQLHAQGQVAEKHRKDGNLLECAEAFRKIYAANPQAKDAYKALYNSAVCFEQARSIGLAINFFKVLVDKFPEKPQAKKALYRLGYNFGAIARYKTAAGFYEKFATKYGGETKCKDKEGNDLPCAPAALNNAVFYRRGIGDDKQAIKNTNNFVKRYKNKKDFKDKAASALFSIALIHERRNNKDALIKHLEKYIGTMGKKGGNDRLVMAYAKLGELYWNKSCPLRKSINGACVKITRERSYASRRKRKRRGSSLPTQCGEASKIKLRVVKRDRRMVGKAKANFKKAIAAYNKGMGNVGGAGKEARLAQAGYFASMSKFYQAEEEYEKFLDVKFPTKLDFDPRNKKKAAKSVKRFTKWLETKKKMSGKNAAQYKKLVDNILPGGAHWAIASAARIGQITQNFADGLYTAEIPRDVRTGAYAEDKVDAYCDQLTTNAEPLEKISVAAFGFCLENTTKLNWFNEWSRLCEKELGQIRPQDFPPASETHAPASGVRAVTDTQGIITKLAGGDK